MAMQESNTGPEDGKEPTEEQTTPKDDVGQEPTEDDGEDSDTDTDWRDGFDAKKAHDRIRKLQSEAKNLRDRAKAAEGKASSVDDLTKERDSLAQSNLRYEVAFELGLPRELAKRLQGSTKEEMLADAEDLVALAAPRGLPSPRPKEQLTPGGQSEGDPVETDLTKIGARMFGR